MTVRIRPDNFAEVARQGLTNKQLMQRFGVSWGVITRWRQATGATADPTAWLRRPEEFADYADTETLAQLMERFGVGERMIRRWRKELGITGLPDGLKHKLITKDRAPVPDGFELAAAAMTLRELTRYYHRDARTVMRWYEATGAERKIRFGPPPQNPARRPNPSGFVTMPAKAHHVAMKPGAEEDAAQHLRRLCAVYRCTETGAADQKGKFWRVGAAMPMTGEEMIARARRNGWTPWVWEAAA